MNWTSCFSAESVLHKRSGTGARSHYQRDFDRLIFSSAFRRLQSKTQVFPLPGSTFVHNRLTHSLEVASVGRSLGAMVGSKICTELLDASDLAAAEFYKYDLPNVIASACLAHDAGNPAFGHSGEKAISNYFISFENDKVGPSTLRSYFSDQEWNDLINFEGNANALRVLTQQFRGKNPAGLGLTVTTLASILKYPCSSSEVDRKYKHRKKYGYFQSEKEIFNKVVTLTGMNIDNGEVYSRHPFVYLVEAADDICYSIIDMEDAHRLGIIDTRTVSELFMQLITEIGRVEDNLDSMKTTYESLTDENEAISYLRAKAINAMVNASADIFMDHHAEILAGTFNNTMIDLLEESCPVIMTIERMSIDKIYNHHSVVEIEIAGYNVMSELLQLFIPAALRDNRTALDESVLTLVPKQFRTFEKEVSPYLRTMSVLDHISSMTDTYATELYRKIKGIEISKHQ